MEVEDSKNDLEVGLDKDFLSFEPLSKWCKSLLVSHCPLMGLPQPCNNGQKNNPNLRFYEGNSINLH